MKFGAEIYSSQKVDDVPLVELAPLSDEIYASYTGPDNGLAYALDNKENGEEVAGVRKWNVKDQKAYGICLSLYEQHPVNGKMSGDPVADAFAICARENNCIMVIADGVNWGEKSRLAARCALYGSMNYINHKIFARRRYPSNTHDVLDVLRASFDEAHRVILERQGGLTTLCACLVCPVKNSNQYAVCCLNVGDSYGYIFSHNQGIREVTQGSHDVSLVRDIRDAGGALGPVDGQRPELHNLTYGLSFANYGDIVFLTTDGISDNYDPVVTKIAIPRIDSTEDVNSAEKGTEEESAGKASEEKLSEEKMSIVKPATSTKDDNFGKPEMEPKERHIYAMKEMERIVHEHELVTEEQCSAQELCSAIVQHVLLMTDIKRKVLENPDLYARKRMSQKDKKRRDSEIVSKMSSSPGKLDHASIVAYEVGLMKPDLDQMDCIPLEGTTSSESDNNTYAKSSRANSQSSHTKKIRPKKLFNKFKNNLNFGNSAPNSPTTENSSHDIVSPKRFSFRRSRSRPESGAMSPTSPTAPELQSPTYENVMSPFTTPMSPGSPMDGVPPPIPHPFRKPMAFESSI